MWKLRRCLGGTGGSDRAVKPFAFTDKHSSSLQEDLSLLLLRMRLCKWLTWGQAARAIRAADLE